MTRGWHGRRWLLRLALAPLPACGLAAALLLAGCATAPDAEDGRAGARGGFLGKLFPGASRRDAAAGDGQAAGPPAFDLEIKAPDDVRQYLARHLELQRYRTLSDLDAIELRRLLAAADANARELLGTLGYFSPELTIEVIESPRAAAPVAATPPTPSASSTTTATTTTTAPLTVVITVQPGAPVRIGTLDIGFAGDVANNAAAAGQRAGIRAEWPLPPGQRFTQAGWDDAKAVALRLLTNVRYPTGRIESSRAEIDTDTQRAALSLKLDSGPAFRFGPLQVSGTQHFTPELVQRLARLPTGADYDQQRMLEAQQRVADSGFFDSVFFTLDASADPQAAPVLAQVREAPLQKLVLGVGASTDAGPRISVEHTHLQLPVIGWRAVTKLAVDRNARSAGIELTAQPDEHYWRWLTSGLWESKDTNGVRTDSQRYRVGRSQVGERLDRNYYLQYDNARDTGVGLLSEASSLSANYAWTQRNFDSLFYPQRGWGLGVELGGGTTLGSTKTPFARTRANWLAYVPVGGALAEADGSRVRGARLALRAEGGAVLAREGATLPSTQLFLAGGDNSVRGYGYRDIGIVSPTGQVSAGRYLAVGSVEWQRPLIFSGRLSDWEATVFMDAGAVADKPAELRAKVGVGVGARWRSPVGPLQLDLAYGVQARTLRLHMNVGFNF